MASQNSSLGTQESRAGAQSTDAEAFVQDWMERFSDPRPMIEILEESLHDRETERDWLLDHIWVEPEWH